jgi:hypothetical protein
VSIPQWLLEGHRQQQLSSSEIMSGAAKSDQDLCALHAGMTVVSNMIMAREPSADDANSFLADVFTATKHNLDLFQSLQDLFTGIIKGEGKPKASHQQSFASQCIA